MTAVITTARLRLQPLSHDDLEPLLALWTEPGVRRFLFDDEIISREQVTAEIDNSIRRFETDGCGLWGALPREETKLIGFCGFRFFHDPPELQLLYGFHPDHWSKGLATEAARAMIGLAFERLGLQRVVASADAPNIASLRVMERAGMKFDRRQTVNGLDTVYYRLDRQDYVPDSSLYELLSSFDGGATKTLLPETL